MAQRVRDAIQRNGGREEVAQRVRDAVERNKGRPEVAQRVRDAIQRNGGREEVAQRVRDAVERNGGREEVAQRVRDAIQRNRERPAVRDPSEIRSRVRDSIERNGGIQEVAQQVKQDPSRLMDRVETRIRRDSRLSEEQQTLVIANLRNFVKEFQNSGESPVPIRSIQTPTFLSLTHSLTLSLSLPSFSSCAQTQNSRETTGGAPSTESGRFTANKSKTPPRPTSGGGLARRPPSPRLSPPFTTA